MQFEGEGVTANARERAIGGHPGEIVSWICRIKYPSSPYADKDGYVPYGKLIDYGAGRSNGCTSWPASDAEKILPLAENKPTTVYIYPEATRHRGRGARGEGRPVAVARRIVLERVLLARDRRAELLAEGDPRAGPRAV